MPSKKNSDGYYRYKEMYKGVQIDLRAKTNKDLIAKVNQKKNDIDCGKDTKAKEISVAAWGELWLETYKLGKVQEPEFKRLQLYMSKYINPEIGSMKLSAVTQMDIQRLLNKHDGENLWLVKKIEQIINAMMVSAIANRRIIFNPCTGVSLPNTWSGSYRALTDEERKIFLAATYKYEFGLWFRFLLYTGLRPQETVPLVWGDINQKEHTVHVSKALKATGEIGDPKSTAGDRYVPIPTHLYNELEFGADDELVFPTAHSRNGCGGKMMTHKTMQLRWKALKNKMLIEMGAKVYRNKIVEDENTPHLSEDLVTYCLRHTYCTDLCNCGVPLVIAKDLMGHADGKMIEQVYNSKNKKQTQLAAAMMEEYYRGEQLGGVK